MNWKCACWHRLNVSLSCTNYARCKMTLVSSQAEVDALIEMVSRLKTEKEVYKLETRRLWHVLQDYDLGGRCLASSAVSPVEEDIVIASSLVDRVLLYGHGRSGTVQPMQVPSGTPGMDEDMAMDTFEESLTPSPERCRRASTVSSYLSSSRSSSAADVSSSDDLLGCSQCDSALGASVKHPLLRGFNGLRVTDIDGERLDNVVAMLDGYFTDNNGKCYECHQQADVATVYDSIESPDGATGCHGPLRYARRVSRQKRARKCNKVNFIMHIWRLDDVFPFINTMVCFPVTRYSCSCRHAVVNKKNYATAVKSFQPISPTRLM